MSMNTRLSGSARVDDIKSHQHNFFMSDDDIKSHPQGELRGLTKLVKITADVRKYAAEQAISEDEALKKGMEQKSQEFVKNGAEVYAKAGR